MKWIDQPRELGAYGGGVFVPTMGALHEGHAALIRRARAIADAGPGDDGTPAVIVSIFVNPTQFNDPADLERYPRALDRDAAIAREAGADVIFAPSAEVVYPPGEDIAPPPLPDVAMQPRLEDAFRPGHFRGVCQAVARLFDLVAPSAAVFGEKDYQQLRVIEEMAASENRDDAGRWPGLRILRAPTRREADGLAMSSRNIFLSDTARASALGIIAALRDVETLAGPGRDARRIEERMRAVLVRHQLALDYAVIRRADTLLPIETIEGGIGHRALIAAHAGGVRLIDNLAVG